MTDIDFIPLPNDEGYVTSHRPQVNDSKESLENGSNRTASFDHNNADRAKSDVVRKPTFLLLLLIVVALLFYRLYPLVDFAYNTCDDRLLGLIALEHGFSNWEHDFQVSENMGRFFFSSHLLLMRAVFLGDYPVAQAWNIGLIALNIVLFSCLIGRVFKNRFIGLLYALIFIVSIDIGDNHNLFISWPVVYQLGFLFGLSAAFMVHADKWFSWARYPIFFALYFLFCLLLTESVVLFLPLFFLLAIPQLYSHRKIRWGKAISLAMPTALYCAVYFLFRLVYGSDYDGNHLAEFDLIAILETCFTFSFGITIPGMRFMLGKGGSWNEVWRSMNSPTTITFAILVFATFCVTVFFATESKLKTRQWRKWIVGAFSGFYLALCPNFLLALTPKYQQWHDNGIITYTGTYFSLYGTSLLMLSLIFLLLQIQRFRFAFLAIASFVLAIGFSLNEYTNQTVGHAQKNHIACWNLVNEWMSTESFRCLPNRIHIATPVEYPFLKTSPLSTFNYFSKYLSIKSGKSISINYVPIENGPFQQPDFYAPFLARGNYAGYLAVTTGAYGQWRIEIYNQTPRDLSFDEIYFLRKDGLHIHANYLCQICPTIPPGHHEFFQSKQSLAHIREQ